MIASSHMTMLYDIIFLRLVRCFIPFMIDDILSVKHTLLSSLRKYSKLFINQSRFPNFFYMKLSLFFSREQLMLSIREILSRFFQAAIVSLILTVYIIYKIITDSTNQAGEEYIIFRTITTLILTFFLSLGVALFYESSKRKFFDRAFPILPIVYGVIFYFTVKF